MPFLDDQAGLTTSDIQRLVPTGAMLPYSGASAPGGYLIPDGSAVLRSDFPELNTLYSSQGYPFGNGDGSTTFNLPDGRSRSFMMIGTGSGLSARTMGQKTGEETHALTSAENGTHTHVQNPHLHTTNPHSHVQNAHTHLQNAHTHTQNSHAHTMDSHNHTQDAHTHTQNSHVHVGGLPFQVGWGASFYGMTTVGSSTPISPGVLGAQSSQGHNTSTVTASNQTTVATNQATVATMQNATATNQNTTAVNQDTTAVNLDNLVDVNAATAVNQDSGSGTGHNTVHPVLCVNWILKY